MSATRGSPNQRLGHPLGVSAVTRVKHHEPERERERRLARGVFAGLVADGGFVVRSLP